MIKFLVAGGLLFSFSNVSAQSLKSKEETAQCKRAKLEYAKARATYLKVISDGRKLFDDLLKAEDAYAQASEALVKQALMQGELLIGKNVSVSAKKMHSYRKRKAAYAYKKFQEAERASKNSGDLWVKASNAKEQARRNVNKACAYSFHLLPASP